MKVITPAASEPISLAMARKQCKVDAEGSPPAHEDDDLIVVFTKAAREWCEGYLGVALAPALVETYLDAFPSAEITLEGGPVLAVEGVHYFDEDGVEQTLDPLTYRLDTTAAVAVLRLETDQEWPATEDTTDAVRVRYSIGYSLPDDSPQDAPLPALAKSAMLLLIRHLYDNRSQTVERNLQVIPFGVTSLLSMIPGKVRRGFA